MPLDRGEVQLVVAGPLAPGRAGSPRPGQAASASVALTGRHGRLPRLRPRFRLGRTVRMRSASAEASGARRHRPWLTRTPRCGLRTSPLCTVPCVLKRRAATARGWGASCAPGSGMALAPAPATLVLPDHIGQCTLVPTTCRTHPFTLAPWHHRSSSSRSRSTETLPPRGAMATSCVDNVRPGASKARYCRCEVRCGLREPIFLRAHQRRRAACPGGPRTVRPPRTRTSLGRAARTASCRGLTVAPPPTTRLRVRVRAARAAHRAAARNRGAAPHQLHLLVKEM